MKGKFIFPVISMLSLWGYLKGLGVQVFIMYFGGWFYTADTFYLKISLFYFTDIPTYKKTGITYSLH